MSHVAIAALDTAERRRYPRHSVDRDSVLFAQKYGPGVAAAVKNVSACGMMARTLRRVQGAGDFFVLLFGEGAKDLVFRRARIVWQDTGDDGSNYVGLEFLGAPSDELYTWMRKATVEN